jgi:hypothetical protein
VEPVDVAIGFGVVIGTETEGEKSLLGVNVFGWCYPIDGVVLKGAPGLVWVVATRITLAVTD